MRLCGITSRFQLLSPSTGQVIHALLTRPPLSVTLYHPKNLLRNISLDLHVLNTPPAFILSQDQTLMLNKISCYTGYQSQVQFCAVERGSGQEL